MCGLLESCDINTYDPSSACGLWADDMHRKPSYRRVKPVGSKHEALVDSFEGDSWEVTVILDDDHYEESLPSDCSSEIEETSIGSE